MPPVLLDVQSVLPSSNVERLNCYLCGPQLTNSSPAILLFCKKLIITLCGVVSDGVIFTPSVVKIGQLVGGGDKNHLITSFTKPVLFFT